MYKKLLASMLVTASFLNSQVDNKQFEDYLNEHNQAFKALEPFADKIQYNSWTEYYGNTTVTHHQWIHPTDQSKLVHNAYREASKLLENEIFFRSLGDGFMLGSIMAVVNKLINGQKNIDKKLIGASIIASSILLTLYQNKNTEKTPYFSTAIRKHDNLFAQMSLLTFGRMFCSMLSATVGFCGTDYMLDRLANLKNRRLSGKPSPAKSAA